jgi:FkbM family methyltransferase
MRTTLRRLRSRIAAPAPAPVTTRYGGPSWEQRRARLFDTLGIDLVLDVGANAGQYATEIRRGGYTGRIVSFEPGSETFARLERASGPDPDWTAHRQALGAEPGTATLNIAANEGKSSSLLDQREVSFGTTATMRYVDAETVEVVTLDRVGAQLATAQDRIYLKIDVQGLELAVIEGAGSFLPRVQAVETELALYPLYEEQSDWRAICDRLGEVGFAFFAVDPGYSDPHSGRMVEMDALFVREELARLD